MPILETVGDYFGGRLKYGDAGVPPDIYRANTVSASQNRNPRDPRASWEAIRLEDTTYPHLAEGLRHEFSVPHWTILGPNDGVVNVPSILYKPHEWERLHYVFGFDPMTGANRVAIADTRFIPLTQEDLQHFGGAEFYAVPQYIAARSIFEDPRRWMYAVDDYIKCINTGFVGGTHSPATAAVCRLEWLIALMGSHDVVRMIAGNLRRIAKAVGPLIVGTNPVAPIVPIPNRRIARMLTAPFDVCRNVIDALAASTPLISPRSAALVRFARDITPATTVTDVIGSCDAAFDLMQSRDSAVFTELESKLLRGKTKTVAFYGENSALRWFLTRNRPVFQTILISSKVADFAEQRESFHTLHSPYPDWVRVVPYAQFSEHKVDMLVLFPTSAEPTQCYAEQGSGDLVATCRTGGSTVHAVCPNEDFISPLLLHGHIPQVQPIPRAHWLEAIPVSAIAGYWLVP